ncbi:MAG: RsmB/NOP family class I SAM-dependent RNA methyltransferase, partial [Paracoccaceae bacterium]
DVPAWVLPEITRSLGADTQSYLDTLRHRAPVWLRVNTVRATPEQARASLARDGIATAPHPDVKGCLHVQNPKSKVHLSQSFLQGVVDLQDAASQAVIGTIPLEPGHRVLDFCAGGGGKALAMAARGVATVEAHDVNPARMADIPDRAARLGVQITCVAQPKGPYDLVLCDAPCSGSGSWRRAPDGKWTLTPDGLETLKTTQVDILGHAAKLVAKGGVLAYATCSVLRCENEETVDRFTKANPGWVCTAQTRWVMGALGDGFFIATLSHQ